MQRDLFRILRGLVALPAKLLEDKCFSMLLALLSELWKLPQLSRMCGAALCGVSQPKELPRLVLGSSSLLSILIPFSQELLGALEINTSGDMFFTADVSWVVVRGVRAGVLRKEEVTVHSPVSTGRLGGTVFG